MYSIFIKHHENDGSRTMGDYVIYAPSESCRFVPSGIFLDGDTELRLIITGDIGRSGVHRDMHCFYPWHRVQLVKYESKDERFDIDDNDSVAFQVAKLQAELRERK